MGSARGWILGLVAIGLGLAAPFAAADGTTGGDRVIDVRGSTTAEPIARAFAETYAATYPGVRIHVSATGSADGAGALIEGRCDIALMSRFMKQDEFEAAVQKGVRPTFHSLATDAIGVIAHPDNPVRNLTRDQLRGIYNGSVTDWRRLGGPEARIVVLSRNESSGTRAVFDDFVLQGGPLGETEIVAGHEQMRARVAAEPAAIGYVGSGYLNGVSIVSVNGTAPTFKTINDGTYPLARHLYTVTDGYPKMGSHLHRLVTMQSTSRGKRIIAGMGWYDSWVGRMKGFVADVRGHVIKVGVLAGNDKEKCREEWWATVGYLNRALPGNGFELVPLGFEEVFSAVEEREVEFILADPSSYVQMAALYGVRGIATLRNLRLDRGHDQFASVIFRRADRADLRTVQDLAGKAFMAVGEDSFAGWQMAWYEMTLRGFDPHEQLAELRFGGTQDAVVYAVRDGLVDAGTVRSSTLERMAAKGEIHLEEFRVIGEHTDRDVVPFLHSTDHYPEWPMAAVPHAPEPVVREVAGMLLAMPANTAAARDAHCAGWTVLRNYQSVRKVLQKLGVGPFAGYGKVTFRQVMAKHWLFVAGAVILFGAVLLVLAHVSRLNKALRESVARSEELAAVRRQVQQDLIKAKENFRKILARSPFGVVVVGLDRNIRWANDFAVELAGVDSMQVMLDQPCGKYLCPARQDECPILDRDESLVNSERILRRCDGTEIPVLKSVVRTELDGEPVLIETFVDISDRKRAEEKLRASEERHRVLFESSRDAIMTLGPPTWKFTSGNPAAHEMFGVGDEEEFTSLGAWDVSPDRQPDGRPSEEKAQEMIQAAMREGSHFFEWTHKRLHGETFPATVLLTRMELRGRQLLQATVRDITPRKEAEQERKRIMRYQQALLKNVPACIFLKDRQRRYTAVNHSYQGMFLRDISDATGLTDDDIYPPRLAEQFRREDEQVMEEGRLLTKEESVRLKDGSEAYVTVRLAPVAAKDGRVTGMVGIALNITDRRQAEKRLEDLNARLERSNRDLQEFTYTVSHDLQAPLRKIHTFGQFLEEDCGDLIPEEGLDHLHRMQGAAVRMKELIQHLLALSRVKTRGAEFEPVEPKEVIETVLDDLGEHIAECEAQVEVDATFPTVMADEVQLRQLFQNLITNALKFASPDRLPRVSISGRLDGDDALFAVCDNGIGIDPKYREKIFGIFQRLHRREDYEGAGVGLALCEKIARRHGGKIWVESEPGAGSQFYFTLRIP